MILRLNLVCFFLVFFLFKSSKCDFLSPELVEVLKSTYLYSPKLKVERELLMKEDELIPQAFSEFRPKIDGYYNKGKIDTAISGSNFIADGVRTETNAGIKITQPIFNGGSTINSIKSAKKKIKAQRLKLKYTEQIVLLEAINIFSSLAAKKKELLLNQKKEESLKKKFELAENQFEIGEITMTDVSIAKARLSLARSDFIKTESELFAIKVKFKSLVGIESQKPELFFDFPVLKKDLTQLTSRMIEQNPELLSILFNIKSLNSEIKSLYSRKLPSVKLEAELKKNKGYFRSDSSREVMSAFASVSIPLYQSGLASSKIRELKKELSSEKEFHKLKMNEFKYNLANSWSGFNSSKSKIDAYKTQIEANRKYLEGLNQEMMLGERTLIDILDAEEELIESEYNLIKSFEENFNSYFEILFYIGELNSKSLNLKVNFFDETKNFNEVKFKWLDIIE